MMVTDVVDAYLTRQRSLGMRFEAAGQMLRRFSRAIGNPDIDEVTPEAVAQFLRGRRNAQRDMDAEVQGLDGPVQIRHQPRIRRMLAIAEALYRSCRRNKLPMSIPQKNSADCWKRRRFCKSGTALTCQRCTARSCCCCTEVACALARPFA